MIYLFIHLYLKKHFCVSALEALAAGVHVITTNFGALPETCSEWPTYINYTKNHELMAESFAHAIDASDIIYMKKVCKTI